jgi:putative heme iron utilization protein
VRTRCTVPVLAVPLRILESLRDQIDRSAFEIFAEVLVPSQFAALVPGKQADDIVRNPFGGKGRSREVA